jgi:hypothetical protein
MTNAKDVLEWMAWKEERERNMTNEEWFCQLPTEEKAKWLYDHYVNARADEYYGRQEKTLSEYQKWLVSVHRKIDGTKID